MVAESFHSGCCRVSLVCNSQSPLFPRVTPREAAFYVSHVRAYLHGLVPTSALSRKSFALGLLRGALGRLDSHLPPLRFRSLLALASPLCFKRQFLGSLASCHDRPIEATHQPVELSLESTLRISGQYEIREDVSRHVEGQFALRERPVRPS